MIHLPEIIKDLCFILAVAGLVTLVCKFLRQPVVLGYLIAGFLVSPHVPFLPTVSDTESVKVWAEIGVIFLLFGLGLEFSFKKLAQVGRSASITAVFEVVFMLALGFATGRALGFSEMDSLFLGGILSVSSTTIIVRAFSELGLRGRRFVSLVFGVLIVEDLVAILLLVLLSTIAVTKSLSGAALALSGLRLGFFLAVWFAVGIYAVPIFITKIRRHLSDETTLIVSLGLCLSMVLLATEAGFSPALGAFVMGSILAETSEVKRIEHLLSPVRDLFGAIFFVSVGMLIDPAVLSEHFGTILLLSVVTIVGKLFSTAAGALLSGEPLKTSVQAGMSLAQIGEFSFIIATLGLSLKVTGDFLYPIAVSVSALTTFTTPYLIKFSGPAADRITAWLPEKFKLGLLRYQSSMARDSESLFGLLWKNYGIKLFLNSVVVLAIALGASELFSREAAADARPWVPVLVAFVVLLMSAPFLWAVILGRSARAGDLDRLKGIGGGLYVLRVLIGLGLIVFSVSRFVHRPAQVAGITLVSFMALLLWRRFAKGLYGAVEDRFMANLRQSDEPEKPVLAPWDAVLAEFVVAPNSGLVAKTLEHVKMRETFGVTLGMIQRGNRSILAPGRNDILLPHDRIFVIGTDEQLANLREVVETSPDEPEKVGPYGLEKMILPATSPFTNKTIRDCGLREKIQGLIVGIERGGKRILNPDSSLVLQAGDLLWVVGDKRRIVNLP